MNEFYFLKQLNQELLYTLKDMTGFTNIFIKDVHIESGKTTIKYEILSKEGFQMRETFFLNNIK